MTGETKAGPTLEQYDDVRHFWCPMLGQPMNFGYCRSLRSGRPCHKVAVCFSPHFDVGAYLASHYSPSEVEEILTAGQSRLETVMNTVEQSTAGAKERDS